MRMAPARSGAPDGVQQASNPRARRSGAKGGGWEKPKWTVLCPEEYPIKRNPLGDNAAPSSRSAGSQAPTFAATLSQKLKNQKGTFERKNS